ncbi:MAG: EndoU domain-containing protein [Halopseudomonas aestusnigri]
MMRAHTTLMVIFFLLLFTPVKAQSFQPFFDDENEKAIDPTPNAPVITPFGKEVLKLCGDWGSQVSERGFLQALSGSSGEEVLNVLQVRMRKEDLSLNLSAKYSLWSLAEKKRNELGLIWFGANGFRHIFCGEPKRKKIGGLHYRGRYLQMQKEGWGGLDISCHKMQISPPVYTIGVFYQRSNKTKGRACVKGYSHSLDAEELFVEVTIAYLRVAKNFEDYAKKKAVCLHEIEEDGHKYSAVFVANPKGIITFYPIVFGTREDVVNC